MSIAYVKGASNGIDASGSNIAATLASAVVSGDLITGFVGWGSTTLTDLTSVTDDKGNSYTIVNKVADATNAFSTASFYLANITNAPTVITANYASAKVFRSIVVSEWSGIATSTPLDGNAGQDQITPGAGTDAVKSGSFSTTVAGDLVVCGSVELPSGLTTAFTPGTGFTQGDKMSLGTAQIDTEYLIQGSAGAINPSWTDSTGASSTFITHAMAFKAASAPTITLNPKNALVFSGNTAQFTVAATFFGTSPTYQWQDNSSGVFANVSGGSGATTATYTTAAATVSGIDYRCIVADSAGSTTSQSARLGVTNFSLILWDTSVQSGADVWLRDPASTSGGGAGAAPGVGSLTFTGYAPTVDRTQSATPGVGSITFTGYAPTIAQPQAAAPGAGNLVFTGYAPTILQTQSAQPGAGAIAISGFAPTISQPVVANPAVGSLTITGYAPNIAQPQGVTPDIGNLAISGYAPAVDQTTAGAVAVNPDVGPINITGYAPTVQITVVAPVSIQEALSGGWPMLMRPIKRKKNDPMEEVREAAKDPEPEPIVKKRKRNEIMTTQKLIGKKSVDLIDHIGREASKQRLARAKRQQEEEEFLMLM